MIILVALGSVLVVAGVGGLSYCIWQAFAIRRKSAEPDLTALRRLIPINLASVALAALGLALMVAGLTLG